MHGNDPCLGDPWQDTRRDPRHRVHLHTPLANLPLLMGDPAITTWAARRVAPLEAALLALVRQPVRTRVLQGRRFVAVLGMAIFECHPDGSFQVWLWTCRPDGGLQLEAVPDEQIAAEHIPATRQWIRFHVDAFCARSGIADALSAEALGVLKDWLNGRLAERVWGPRLRREVRQVVARHLPVDRQSVVHARALAWGPARPRVVRLNGYHHAWRHRAAYELTAREAPALLALLDVFGDEAAALCADHERHGEHLDVKAALRQVLLSHGVSPGFWRLLARQADGRRLREWLGDFLGWYALDGLTPRDVAVRSLLAAQAGGTDDWPESDLLIEAFDAVAAHTERQGPELLQAVLPVAAFLGRLRRMAQRATADERLRISTQAAEMVEWASREHLVQPPGYLERVQLPTVLRLSNPERAAQWRQLRRVAPFRYAYSVAVEHPVWEVVPLGTALDLWREGERMRHCVADRWERADRGHSLFASVRAKGPGSDAVRPVATLELELRRGVRLVEIRGYRNGEVPREVMALAQACVAAVRAQKRALARRRMSHILVDQMPLFEARQSAVTRAPGMADTRLHHGLA